MRGQRGYTLIEMMVVVAIVGILLVAGIPTLTDMLANSRLRAVADQHASGLRQARLEAVRRNATVTFTPQGTGWVIARDGVAVTSKDSLASESLITVTPSSAVLSFDGRGRASGLYQATVSQSGCRAEGGAALCLSVRVGAAGSVLTCDPAAKAPDTRACPA